MRISKKAIGFLLVVMLLVVTLPAAGFAAMGEIDSFTFSESSTTDKLGAGTSLTPDGKADAAFDISVRGNGAIVRVTLKNLTTGAVWDTSPSSGASVLLIENSKGEKMNSGSGMQPMVFVFGTQMKVWINDRATALAKDSKFSATVTFVDKSTATQETTVKAVGEAATTTSANPNAACKIVSADFRGEGDYDYVGSNNVFKANLNPDDRIDMTINSDGGSVISGVKIKSLTGNARSWETQSGTQLPRIAVTDSQGTVLNKSDGTISYTLGAGNTKLSFWFDDASAAASDKYQVTLLLSNGKVLTIATEAIAQPGKGAADKKDDDTKKRDATRTATMTSKPMPLSKGVVAKSEATGGTPGKANYSMMINVRGTGTIMSIELENLSGTGRWDTIPKNGRPIIGVRQSGKLLNKSNSSVLLQVKGKATYELVVEDNGSFKKTSGRFLLLITWADDTETQSLISW